MQILLFIVSVLLISTSAQASECRHAWEHSLEKLRKSSDPDQRSREGQCLLRYHLNRPAVTQVALKIIRDSKEDVLLREDLIEAFAKSTLRKQIKVEGTLSPELDKQDQDAVDRTVASAQDLIALTQAVKSMNEVVAVTRHEQEFIRAISELALDDTNPVLLRAVAVSALEQASKKIFESGLYDERGLRQVQETLNTIANRDDNGGYYAGAALAYGRLAGLGLPTFVSPNAGRVIASEKAKP